jgi:hypothetical protein
VILCGWNLQGKIKTAGSPEIFAKLHGVMCQKSVLFYILNSKGKNYETLVMNWI